MAEVVWQARRVSDGVLVDVTGDTSGTPAIAPTPNALEVGAVDDGGDGVAVLEDPGVAWQASHAYSVGDRFAETVEGEERVFEITDDGTSGGGVFSDYGTPDMTPLGTWGTNSETFQYIGIVGQLPWTVAPFLGGGLALGPFQTFGYKLTYTSAAPPEESENLFGVEATVDGTPVTIFEIKTDGDSDWMIDSGTGAGMAWHDAVDGAAQSIIMRISTTQFGVTLGTAGLNVDKDDATTIAGPRIKFSGATAAPADGTLLASTFALWLDASPGATKLMIKAKDSGGTVRTGSVNLT